MEQAPQVPTAAPKAASQWQAIKMVLSAFIGIRRHGSDNEDIRVTPRQVVITAIVCAMVFVLSVATVVRVVLYMVKH